MLQLPINRALARLPSLGHGLRASVADDCPYVKLASVHHGNRTKNCNSSERPLRIVDGYLLVLFQGGD